MSRSIHITHVPPTKPCHATVHALHKGGHRAPTHLPPILMTWPCTRRRKNSKRRLLASFMEQPCKSGTHGGGVGEQTGVCVRGCGRAWAGRAPGINGT